MQLSICKTKEMVMDLRRSQPSVTSLSIRGEDVEIVQEYLGLHIDSILGWSKHSLATYRKGQSSMYFLRRLL